MSLILFAALCPPAIDPPLDADPAVPIPTGYPGDAGPFLSAEWSWSGAVRFGVWEREAGRPDEFHWHSAGPVGAYRIESQTPDDDTRLTRLTRVGPGVGPAVVDRIERFLGSRLAFVREGPADVRDRPGRVELRYFPIEGVMVAAGFDTLTLDLFAGVRLGF